MTTFGVPNTFSPGQTPISSAQVNANFAALVNALNSLSIPTTPVTVANGGTGSTTAQAAITALGLAIGTIIPAACSYASGVFSITGLSSSPTVQSYQLGTTYLFVAPAAESATSFSINDVTSSTGGLGNATLYDSFGNLITSVAAGQVMIVTWNNSTTAPGFSLVNLPPPSTTVTARFAQFTSTGTWTAPSNVTQAYFSGCGGGGAGGASSAPGNAGGGGGGGAACVKKQLVNVVPGQTYSVTIGAAGAGATGAAGGAGGLTQMESASFVVLVSCPGGAGGSEGTNASPTPWRRGRRGGRRCRTVWVLPDWRNDHDSGLRRREPVWKWRFEVIGGKFRRRWPSRCGLRRWRRRRVTNGCWRQWIARLWPDRVVTLKGERT
jgi:hypothetical protein